MLEINKIHCGDCLELMKDIPNKSIDLVLTDPPYGLGIDGRKGSVSKNPKHNRKAYEFKGWDFGIPPREYFDEMRRISKNQIIWGGNYFVKYLDEGHKGWIYWDKGQRGLTMSDGELAYTSFDKPLRAFTVNRCEIRKDGSVHPTQKPLKLFNWVIDTYTKAGDIILDPFAGSGTTGVACKNLNRNFILIEKEPEYCKIAEQRLCSLKNYNQ